MRPVISFLAMHIAADGLLTVGTPNTLKLARHPTIIHIAGFRYDDRNFITFRMLSHRDSVLMRAVELIVF
jgi:hypothetical protein